MCRNKIVLFEIKGRVSLIHALTKIFIKNSEDTENPEVRAAYGNMSGIIGIILNLCLFLSKLIAGIISSSVSVIADAFNNLSDAGSSVVTFIGFKLAHKPADREHPFGHGRYEYVAGLGISVVIFLVGFELILSSFQKILNPEAGNELSVVSLIILIASVCVKAWMYFFNKILSKKINSNTLKAASLDSLTDCIATTVVILGLVISYLWGINIDGYLGIAVALFILFTGVNTMKDSISPLIGNPPDEDMVNEIRDTVLAEEKIIGVHDLIVHDYGAGRCIISLHAELPDKLSLIEAHDAIDRTEKLLEQKFRCMATIHLDPIAADDMELLALKNLVADKICEIDNRFSIHDFREVRGERTKLIFDLAVPYECKMTDEEIRRLATDKIRSINQNYEPIIQIEKLYSGCL